jgi:hypothetical protein
MHSQAVQILSGYLAIHQCVEFVNHKAKSMKLVYATVQMHTYILVHENLTRFHISIDITYP